MHHVPPFEALDSPLDVIPETTPVTTGSRTTFAYSGEAHEVSVRHFCQKLPPLPPMTRHGAGWAVTVELPVALRLEYRLAVDAGDGTDLIVDPANPHRAADPFGENSVAFAPGYQPPWWTTATPRSRGRLVETRVRSAAFHHMRTVRTYLPAEYETGGRYPLVLALDGGDLLEYAGLADVLDTVIEAGATEPLVVSFVSPVDRNHEYMADPGHADFVAETVRHLRRRYRISHRQDRNMILGASLGGIAALAAARAHPELFGSLILLSASLVTETGGPWNRPDMMQPVVDFLEDLQEDASGLPHRVYMGCGEYEALSDDNRSFANWLLDRGVELRYDESRDGHHWINWRDLAAAALQWLLPGDRIDQAATVSP